MSKPFSNLKRNSVWNHPNRRPNKKPRVVGVPHMKAPLQYMRDVAGLLADAAERAPLLTDKAVYAQQAVKDATLWSKWGHGSEVRKAAHDMFLWVKRNSLTA